MSEFRLPDVGEGLTEAEIVTWRVAVGDEVKINDVLVDIETAKSIVELPSPYAGRVAELLVSEGQTVAVGTAIVRIGSASEDSASEDSAGEDASAEGAALESVKSVVEEPAPAKPPAVLVGYGPSERKRRTRTGRTQSVSASSVRVLAKPPVRKLAKDLGVDLASVSADGPVVTRTDVLRHSEQPPTAATSRPVTGVRKATAAAMTASALIPQVTEWVTIDVTETMNLVDRLKVDRQFESVKVSATLIAAKAICLALARTPDLHARWAEDAIDFPQSVGLGIAAATERGLVVPVVPDADRLSLVELGRTIDELVATARAGKLQPAQMSGGTFTLTNVGVFGIDGGTPILPPGQSGILALGQVAKRPWVVGDDVVPRLVTTLAVSFDHRVADGEQASRFLRDVADLLEDPARAFTF